MFMRSCRICSAASRINHQAFADAAQGGWDDAWSDLSGRGGPSAIAAASEATFFSFVCGPSVGHPGHKLPTSCIGALPSEPGTNSGPFVRPTRARFADAPAHAAGSSLDKWRDAQDPEVLTPREHAPSRIALGGWDVWEKRTYKWLSSFNTQFHTSICINTLITVAICFLCIFLRSYNATMYRRINFFGSKSARRFLHTASVLCDARITPHRKPLNAPTSNSS
mmetsp:Transcript_86503/g.171738  ORF Transcript_86503/g.171738 Transcript_86503/m.171738 type:complete len:223 (+) Transcript_86503:1799-2467(+)